MISMILYHSCYDYFIVFGRNYNFLKSGTAYLWQQSICISFILVSGMVWTLGKKHALKRGIILILLGTAITFVTAVFMPSEAIYYGILTFMGIATLFTIVYDRALYLTHSSRTGGSDSSQSKDPTSAESGNECKKNGRNSSEKLPAGLIHIIICLILFALTKHLPQGYVGSRYHMLCRYPEALYRYPSLAVFGLPSPDFFSADYFPVIPWIFMYIVGYHLGRLLLDNEAFGRLGENKIPFLSWLGTKSLLVYIIHQPVCYTIIWLICR